MSDVELRLSSGDEGPSGGEAAKSGRRMQPGNRRLMLEGSGYGPLRASRRRLTSKARGAAAAVDRCRRRPPDLHVSLE